jgi:diaminopimelate decarboxylase
LVRALARRAATNPNLRLRGLHSHIGSQVFEVEALVRAARVVADLALEVEKVRFDA